VEAFHFAPAVVFAADARGRLEIDLFVLVLTDVADPEVAGLAIETETPRIAKSVRPDLVSRGPGRRKKGFEAGTPYGEP
jgi:hypothetical protein